MSVPLQEFIDGACSPARYEPDLALNLEICEMINKKQGNAPREAATAIVRVINSKNINQAMLALTLLDNCEFLNQLVRRFPERPAPFPSPVIQRILYLIKEWKVALTDMSRHKDDLIHIKDMYRLLRFKGYKFPDLRDSSVAALAPSESLKSAQELEEEDRVAQSAKLQELIRRGRPQDLVEANHLMKIMSGYDQRSKPDYKQKFEEELHKVQDKAIILYEMLENVSQGERLDRNETVLELKNSCLNAQPKIQKMITEEEDNDKIENLLTLNDMINSVVAKFADIQKGIYDTQYDISGKPPKQTSSSEEPPQAISLIDLDDNVTSSNSTPTATGSALNELNDLFGQTSISTVPSTIPSTSSTNANSNDLFDLLNGPSNNAPPAYSFEPASSNPESSPVLSGFGSPRQQNLSVQPSSSSSSSSTPPPSNNNDSSPVSHPSIPLVNKNGLRIDLEVRQINTQWKFKALFSNQSTAPMENMTLSLAAPKSMQLKMESQSSQVVPPSSQHSVTQFILLNNPSDDPLRLRYKVTYQQFGVDMEQTGDYHA
ncbi:unnamed protein product [Absidia cylindrospora]